MGRRQSTPPANKVWGGQYALHSNSWAVEVSTIFSWAVDRQHHLHTRFAVDSRDCIQTVGRWTLSATFKDLGRGESAPPSKQLCRGQTAPPSEKACGGQSALSSNSWAVDRQHHLQTRCAVDSQHSILTVGPWTDSTTFKQGVRWTVSTTFKDLGRGQSALPSNRWAVDSRYHRQTRCAVDSQHCLQMAVDSQHHLQTRCAVDSQHYIQTSGPWTVRATYKQRMRWTVSTTFKQVCRGQFFGRDIVILTGIHALSKSSCTWKVANTTVERSKALTSRKCTVKMVVHFWKLISYHNN